MEAVRSNRATNVVLPQPVGLATMHLKGCFQHGSMWANEWLSGCRVLLYFQRHRAETVGEYFALPVELRKRDWPTTVNDLMAINRSR